MVTVIKTAYLEGVDGISIQTATQVNGNYGILFSWRTTYPMKTLCNNIVCFAIIRASSSRYNSRVQVFFIACTDEEKKSSLVDATAWFLAKVPGRRSPVRWSLKSHW